MRSRPQSTSATDRLESFRKHVIDRLWDHEDPMASKWEWSSGKDEGTCLLCKARNGKTFTGRQLLHIASTEFCCAIQNEVEPYCPQGCRCCILPTRYGHRGKKQFPKAKTEGDWLVAMWTENRRLHAKEVLRAARMAFDDERDARAWARTQSELILQRPIEASAMVNRPVFEALIQRTVPELKAERAEEDRRTKIRRELDAMEAVLLRFVPSNDAERSEIAATQARINERRRTELGETTEDRARVHREVVTLSLDGLGRLALSIDHAPYPTLSATSNSLAPSDKPHGATEEEAREALTTANNPPPPPGDGP